MFNFSCFVSSNRQTKEELQAEVEMAWDDSALNITVNPIDVRNLIWSLGDK